MTLINEVLDALESLGYADIEVLSNNESLVTQQNTFSAIVNWISNELHAFARIENVVHTSADDDLMSFQIELNSLLRELNSPFSDSPTIDIKEDNNKLAIVNYLCGELFAARMNYVKNNMGGVMSISMSESDTAKDMKLILIALGMGKPPNNIDAQTLFKKIKDKLLERISSERKTVAESLLLPRALCLSPKQWEQFYKVNEQFFNDYTLRREMLLKRCDCTVGSFTWKSNDDDVSKSKLKTDIGKQIKAVCDPLRQQMSAKPNVTLADALAARESDCDDLLSGVITNYYVECLIEAPDPEKLANQGAQQQMQLHKYIIGDVPDRGGRPKDQPQPPKETFAQQKQQRDMPQRGRGRGGRGRGGGGGGGESRGRGGAGRGAYNDSQRVQGSGWAQNDNRYSSHSNNYSKGGYDSQYSANNNCSGGQQMYSQRDNYYGQQSMQSYQNYDRQQQNWDSGGQHYGYQQSAYGAPQDRYQDRTFRGRGGRR